MNRVCQRFLARWHVQSVSWDIMLERLPCSTPGCSKSCLGKSTSCIVHSPDSAQIQAMLREQILKGTLVQDLNLSGMEFRALELDRKVFLNCDFQDTRFVDCHVSACHFSFCFFDGGSFSNFKIESTKILESVFSLAAFSSGSISSSDVLQCNFNGSSFGQVHFHELDLMYSRFIGASFNDCLMEDCNLKSVYLPKENQPAYKYSNSEDALYT